MITWEEIQKAASQIHIPRETWSKLNQNHYVTLEILDKLCQILDCQPEDLLKCAYNDTTSEH